MVNLTVLKEMAQALAELFGLSLPGNSPDKT
jgi:hypothetical protein